jgi:4-hydroxybenzoate polyprenyltransferase
MQLVGDPKASGINLFFKKTYLLIFSVLKLISSTSLLLALNGSMVVIFSSFLLGYRIIPDLLLAAFLVTFSVYSLNKVTDKIEDSINRPEKTTKPVFYFLFPSIISMFMCLLIGLVEGLVPFIVLLNPLLIGLIYSVRVSKSLPRLKDIVGVKSFAVATSWALTGCLLPASVNGANLEKIALVFVYVFIRILVGTILCDFLDRKGDLISGVETIPLRLGRKKTRKLLVIINGFVVVWLVYCIARGLFMELMPALIFGCLYGYLAIWYFFKDKYQRLTANLMLDGEWFPIVVIAVLFNK